MSANQVVEFVLWNIGGACGAYIAHRGALTMIWRRLDRLEDKLNLPRMGKKEAA